MMLFCLDLGAGIMVSGAKYGKTNRKTSFFELCKIWLKPLCFRLFTDLYRKIQRLKTKELSNRWKFSKFLKISSFQSCEIYR